MPWSSSLESPEGLAVRRFYRWGWLPLVAGCALIAVSGLMLGELVGAGLGLGHTSRAQTILYFARGFLIASLMAVWAGWYVFSTRRALERVRDRLRERERALVDRERTAHQHAGLAALSRILAHELRNPLHGLVLQLAVLERTCADALSREAVARGRGEAERLQALLDDYQRTVRSEDRDHNTTLELAAVAEDVIAALRGKLADDAIEIELVKRGELPAVRANPEAIRRVFSNLLENARFAVGRGGHIRVELDADDRAVSVRVVDDGVGFEEPNAVLRPFYSKNPSGAGVGLAIVRDVLRAHGGALAATNRPDGRGAIVAFTLPFVRG